MNSKIHNLSLRGTPGILLGVISLIYVYLIRSFIHQFPSANGSLSLLPISFFEIILVIISFLFMFISYLIIVLINRKRRKKLHLKGWELKSIKIRRVYFIHLILGAIILYILINQGLIKLIIPASLLLYGISSIIANNYTLGKTNYLGVFFLINGILSILNPNQQFILWGLAFGGYHIIYGIFYHKKVYSNF